jgi:hypothetical protein
MTAALNNSVERRIETIRWIGHGLLAAGFLLMMLEIRFEHRQVLSEMKVAWVPIIYSMTMLVLIPVGLSFFKKGGKHLLTMCYVGAIVVGLLGIYMHANGHLIARVSEVLAVWKSWGAPADANTPFYPPILAPFSFLGLGSVGLFLRWRERVGS